MTASGARTHVFTVSVEDYFHSAFLNEVVARKHWTRIESRLERSLRAVLDLLAENQVSATFFVLGWIAERQPELVRLIRSAGHEIASRGYWPGGGVKGLMPHPQQLREELQRAKEALEAAGSNRIYGYRHPRWITRPEELWVMDVLIEEGYRYDSSVSPIFRRFVRDPRWYEAHEHRHSAGNQTLSVYPISTVNVLGQRVPFSGGNLMRQMPHRLMRQAVAGWDRARKTPIVFYFMPWENDDDQPQVRGIPLLQRARQYRRLGKPKHVFRKYFRTYRFQPIGDALGLPWRTAPIEAPKVQRPIEIRSSEPDPPLGSVAVPVTLVVPLYNEEDTVAYLRGTLIDLRRKLGRRYRVHFILVDDASTDSTPERLKSLFDGLTDCQLLRHERNTGVAGAIMTGIRAARTEIVGSIDCDCSYDPNDLENMIPLIESADLVTASPYHPEGHVFNVPSWRLFLSRTLSGMYSTLLGNSVYTYTSCFRVYRKSAVETLDIKHGGFLGVAEFLIRLRLRGGRVLEYPTTLESRLFGESKMKIVRTIVSHLGLLRELLVLRLSGGGPPPLPDSASVLPAPAVRGEERPVPEAVPASLPAVLPNAGPTSPVPASQPDP